MSRNPARDEEWREYVPHQRERPNISDDSISTVDEVVLACEESASTTTTPPSSNTSNANDSAKDDDSEMVACLLPRARESAPYGMTHDPTSSGVWREVTLARARDAYDSFIVEREMEEECCCICLEPFGLNRVAAGACKHLFHTSCIAEWLAKDDEARSCPVCREPFLGKHKTQYCFVRR